MTSSPHAPQTTQDRPLALVDGRVVNPAEGSETAGGVLCRDGRVVAIGAKVTRDNAGSDAQILDCGGHYVSPGLIDMRAFVGEPGAAHRETIAAASAAAASGGITTIIATPETFPPVDGSAMVDYILRRARDNARIRIMPCAALTKGLAGQEIAEIGLLKDAGAVAFSNGTQSVQSSLVMRRCLSYARDFDALVMHYTQDPALAGHGVMNESELATRLGLHGIPAEAEAIMLDRDMRLVTMTGARYHAELVSSSLSIEVIRSAKAAGLPVTCGAGINHLTLNESDIGDYRTFLKILPPLRDEDERQALVRALAEGVIDVIVSDHKPQDVEDKRVPFGEAADGATGLETLLAAGLRLVKSGDIGLAALLRAMTLRPAEILGLPQGRMEEGAPADLMVFDPDEPFVVDPLEMLSRSRNTPFDEARLEGRVKHTIFGGRLVWSDTVEEFEHGH